MMNSTWAGQMGPTSALPTFAQRRQAVQDLQLRRQAAQNELLLLKSTSDALSSSPETTQAVEEKLEAEAGEKPLHREGHRGGIWVLLDYGCLVVHVFNTEAREFYGLERLWSDGKPLDVAALLAE